MRELPPERTHWTSTHIEFTTVIADNSGLSRQESIELASVDPADPERGRGEPESERKDELLIPEQDVHGGNRTEWRTDRVSRGTGES